MTRTTPNLRQGARALAPRTSSSYGNSAEASRGAANYLSVGQIYLMANPLLREALQPTDVKPRLLGHWGTTAGMNFVYAHMNRVIRRRELDAIMVIGPGHGGPAAVANAYLEGRYSEVHPLDVALKDGWVCGV